MSGIPILSIFKGDSADSETSGLFSQYKKIQTLRKLKEIEASKLKKADEKIKKIEQDLTKRSEEVEVLLADKITISAANFQEFCHDNFHKFKEAEFSVDDFDRLFFKYVSTVRPASESDGLIQMKAEISEDNHLIVCQDPENCEIHRAHTGMGILKLDLRDF